MEFDSKHIGAIRGLDCDQFVLSVRGGGAWSRAKAGSFPEIADPGNRTFIHMVTEDAKRFFRYRDPEEQFVPVAATVSLKASKEIRPLKTLAQGGPQGSTKKR